MRGGVEGWVETDQDRTSVRGPQFGKEKAKVSLWRRSFVLRDRLWQWAKMFNLRMTFETGDKG